MVHGAYLEAGVCRGAGAGILNQRIADACSSLPRFAGKKCHADVDLVGLQSTQQARDLGDFRTSARRLADSLRGIDQVA